MSYVLIHISSIIHVYNIYMIYTLYICILIKSLSVCRVRSSARLSEVFLQNSCLTQKAQSNTNASGDAKNLHLCVCMTTDKIDCLMFQEMAWLVLVLSLYIQGSISPRTKL